MCEGLVVKERMKGRLAGYLNLLLLCGGAIALHEALAVSTWWGVFAMFSIAGLWWVIRWIESRGEQGGNPE
jgi:hypothetical protein